MSQQIRPLGNRILLRRRAAKEKSVGGIIIPDNAKEKPIEGVVVALGPGKHIADGSLVEISGVSVGDTVLFGKYAGMEVSLDGETLVIVTEEDLLGVVEGAA